MLVKLVFCALDWALWRYEFVKKLLSLVLSALILVPGFAQPNVGKDLRLALESQAKKISVILRFKDPQWTRSQETPAQIQKRKMSWVRSSQAKLASDLSPAIKTMESIEQAIPLWVNHSLILTASPGEIKEVLQSENILSARLDREMRFLEPPMRRSGLDSSAIEYTYGLKNLRVPRVWSELGITGKGVRVGILDSGLDSSHPDFKDRVLMSRDFASGYEDDQPNDGNGHGTHCAGTLGGGSSSGRAIGVAPGVQLLVGKIVDDTGSAGMSSIMRGMQWIVDPDGNPETPDFPRVISNSWGIRGNNDDFEEIIKTWKELGIIPVFAAGNTGPNPSTVWNPGILTSVITVGAVNEGDSIASFSSRGPVRYQGKTYIKPDLTAPGVGVYSALIEGGYERRSGTSMATPHIAGVVALMLEADPDLDFERVRELLVSSSIDFGNPGLDSSYGEGRVDAYQAVLLTLNGGRVQLQVNTPEPGMQMKVIIGAKTYFPGEDGNLVFHLPQGEQELRVESYGLLTHSQRFSLKKGQNLNLGVEMNWAPKIPMSFETKNAEGRPISGWIEFLETPLEIEKTNGSPLNLELPQGRYKIRVGAKGHKTITKPLTTSPHASKVFVLSKLARVLLVNQDRSSNYSEFYREALDQAGLEFQLESKISESDLMPYESVLWFSGDSSYGALNKREQAMLSRYVQSGGALILTGQDLGVHFSYRNLFSSRVLGVSLVEEDISPSSLSGEGFEFELNGGDSADNQNYPDLVTLSRQASDSARVLFSYAGQGGAAVFNSYGEGKSVYLGFGLEGVRGAKLRLRILKHLLALVQPMSHQRLSRLNWAYLHDKALYEELLAGFLMEFNHPDLAKAISTWQDKSAFRPLLKRLQAQGIGELGIRE